MKGHATNAHDVVTAAERAVENARNAYNVAALNLDAADAELGRALDECRAAWVALGDTVTVAPLLGDGPSDDDAAADDWSVLS